MVSSGPRDSNVGGGDGKHLAATADVRFQLSLFQFMKLVVFCAAAFASVAPIVRLTALGGTGSRGFGLIIYSAICVPLVWASLSFVLVKRGMWRDRFILAMLLCSVLSALAPATWGLWHVINELLQSPRSQDITDFLLVSAVTVTLAASAIFLANRLARKLRRRR